MGLVDRLHKFGGQTTLGWWIHRVDRSHWVGGQDAMGWWTDLTELVGSPH